MNPGYGDTALLQAAAAGRDEAFGTLFDRHAAALYNCLFRRTADWSAAEDLTAAVIVQAWRRRREAPDDPAGLVAARLGSERPARQLRAAVGRLPRQQREVVDLCVYSGLDQQAAAVALGVSAGTVTSRLHRARRRLGAESPGPVAPAAELASLLLAAPAHRDLPRPEERTADLLRAIAAERGYGLLARRPARATSGSDR